MIYTRMTFLERPFELFCDFVLKIFLKIRKNCATSSARQSKSDFYSHAFIEYLQRSKKAELTKYYFTNEVFYANCKVAS